MLETTVVHGASPAIQTVVDPSVLDMVLDCYKPHCRYLHSATVEPGRNGVVVAGRGEFAISESCYIADTGHFNAVEFNICYNQIAYITLAHSVLHGWLDAMASW